MYTPTAVLVYTAAKKLLDADEPYNKKIKDDTDAVAIGVIGSAGDISASSAPTIVAAVYDPMFDA